MGTVPGKKIFPVKSGIVNCDNFSIFQKILVPFPERKDYNGGQRRVSHRIRGGVRCTAVLRHSV
jgi:hypothetical protein